MTPEQLIDAAFAALEAKIPNTFIGSLLKAALATFAPLIKADLLPGVAKFGADLIAQEQPKFEAAFRAELAALTAPPTS